MGGNTIRKEWFDFWDFSPDMASVPAFCQQRQKLLPETMDFLFHSFNDSFSSLETYRGFRLLACDKSDLAIAYTPDDKDTYRRHNSLERHEKGYNQLHLNALYGGIERSFRELKYTIGLTNFHAKKVEPPAALFALYASNRAS